MNIHTEKKISQLVRSFVVSLLIQFSTFKFDTCRRHSYIYVAYS